jgi:Coenzyme PQQ synthesis protein D (PqqD)
MVSIAPHIRSIVDRDGAVIIDIERDAMVTLNSTGGYVWNKLRQGKFVEEIIVELTSETGADIATVDRDVRAFLDELQSRHLIGR